MKKKVLLFIPTFEMGGAERQALNFAFFLKKRGIEVAVAGIAKAHGRTGGVIKDACDKIDIPCFDVSDMELSKLRSWHFKALVYLKVRIMCNAHLRKCTLGLMKILKEHKYDVLLTYCAVPGTVAGIAKFIYKQMPEYVWYQRDAGIRNCEDKLQGKAIRNADFVLANSMSGKAWLQQKYNIEAAVVHNGVEKRAAVYSEGQWLEKLGIDASYMVVTMVANLSAAKDHLTLLKAWKYVLKECVAKKPILVLAGRFDDKYCELKDYALQNNLSDSVKFLGNVSDVFGLYAVTSLCVFSTYSEGNPNALIEAALMGLAAVATDLPEIREVLCEENQKYLFEQGNAKACAVKIVDLLNNPTIAQVIGEKNKENAVSVYGIEERFEELGHYIGLDMEER